jgi:hypothetical protein
MPRKGKKKAQVLPAENKPTPPPIVDEEELRFQRELEMVLKLSEEEAKRNAPVVETLGKLQLSDESPKQPHSHNSSVSSIEDFEFETVGSKKISQKKLEKGNVENGSSGVRMIPADPLPPPQVLSEKEFPSLSNQPPIQPPNAKKNKKDRQEFDFNQSDPGSDLADGSVNGNYYHANNYPLANSPLRSQQQTSSYVYNQMQSNASSQVPQNSRLNSYTGNGTNGVNNVPYQYQQPTSSPFVSNPSYQKDSFFSSSDQISTVSSTKSPSSYAPIGRSSLDPKQRTISPPRPQASEPIT